MIFVAGVRGARNPARGALAMGMLSPVFAVTLLFALAAPGGVA